MTEIVILEDEAEAAETLKAYLERFARERGTPFDVRVYDNAVDLLDEYDTSADIMFMDIQMPLIDGMSAAKKIRERDKNVLMVFVTNLAQYAIEGYDVGAFDFILKPVRYTGFSMKLDRMLKELAHRRSDITINLYTRDGMCRVAVSDIYYAEVMNHDVILHTTGGDLKMRTSLSKLCEQLADYHFALCNACYLVNLRYVTRIDLDFVTVADHKLRISQSKRKAFLQVTAKYCGGSE